MRHFKNIFIVLALTISPILSYAECNQYKIVDHGDYLEAVCDGAPITEVEREKNIQDSLRRDQEIASQQKEIKSALEQEELQRKLSKVNCTGQPGECGPGRFCGKLSGTCKDKNEVQQNNNNIKNGIQQTTDFLRNNEINDKLDQIDRRLRQGY